MKVVLLWIGILATTISLAQEKDTTKIYKKRVLDVTEVDFVSSYYEQAGTHAAVSGGIGTEKLKDLASKIIVATPMNEDDVLTVDVGLSAYTSASSSNVNPFSAPVTSTGASGQAAVPVGQYKPTGTPWQASTGASGRGTLFSLSSSYSHSSNDRNFIWNADVSLSNEYNYSSKGIGGGITKLYNHKNTEFSIKANAYFDNWTIIYPTELNEYNTYGNGFLSNGYLKGVSVFDQNGNVSHNYLPSTFKPWDTNIRNSFSTTLSYSQVVNQKMQFSLFLDVLQQQGMLSTPYQRIYFADTQHYFIGDKSYIPVYQTSANNGVYQLADDIERLPNKRFKLPVGMRWNYYINEKYTLRTYLRYYQDDWGIQSNTLSVEVPYKLNDLFTIYPIYRYYTQTASKYFAPFEQHLSTEQYYTSDYDLSGFNTHQFGVGASFIDLSTQYGLFFLGIKNIDLRRGRIPTIAVFALGLLVKARHLVDVSCDNFVIFFAKGSGHHHADGLIGSVAISCHP